MRIKELHLRNIASIEKADINFEEDLTDAVTDDPASIFLISGDTGAGKSVILDGISMALYKKTPRTEGVVNTQKNNFTNQNGVSIKVNSIEQYTRLGISENDECYSELIFEGNDGKEYHAKLTLGIMKGKTDESGKRPLKYRTPVWEYKEEKKDWEKVEANTGRQILAAVGLNFDQFGRMAMLAQGQFASFLTGDKKEREAILEQLTNTERFSKYGEAIKNIFNNASSEKKNAETQYKTELTHILPQEKIDNLNTELQTKNKEKDELDEKQKQTDSTLKLVETFLTQQKTYNDGLIEKKKIETIIEGNEYKKKKTLISDWDNTDNERNCLTNKKAEEDKKTKAEEGLQKVKSRFHTLSADIEYRRKEISTKEQEIRQLENWINERNDRDSLFTSANAIVVQIGQYIATTQKITRNSSLLTVEEGKTDSLKKEFDEKGEKLSKAQKDVDEKQKEIENLTQQRNILNPLKLNEDIRNYSVKINALANLTKEFENLEKLCSNFSNLNTTIKQDEEKLKELKKITEEKETAHTKAKENYEKTSKLLSTMKMSVQDTLKELRKRMHEEHAKTCPLCGQHIENLGNDEEFSKIISPLQEEEKKARLILETATQEKEDAQSKYNTLNGSLSENKKKLNTDQQELISVQKNIENEAQKLGLDISKDLQTQIIEKTNGIKETISKLEESQKKAEQLQQEINNQTNKKKYLEKIQSSADEEKQKAEKALEKNKLEIANLNKNILEFSQEKDTLKNDLQPKLRKYYPTWESKDVRPQLTNDTKEYISYKDNLQKAQGELAKSNDILTQINDTKSEILRTHSDWDTTVMPTQYNSSDVRQDWNTLFSEQKELDTQIKDSEKEIHDANIVLSNYYTQNKKDETYLWNIINHKEEISSARTFISVTDTNLQTSNAKIAEAEKIIKETLEKLQVTTEADIQNKEELQNNLAEIKKQQEDCISQISSITTQLNENQKNQDGLEKAKELLNQKTEIFNKWDKLNKIFGGDSCRTLVQTYILRPLLNNANIYLEKITDRYTLTCSEENEQLSILVLDRYNKNNIRSATILSGGERFMISLALSLALSSLNRQDMNVNILFIDEGFGTLDEKNLDSVMSTLEKLQEIAGQSKRRVGVISHREELDERIPVKIHVVKKGEGRSNVVIEK